MSYNIHPLFVHFPIALLFIYSIIKILPLRKWFPRIAWKDIEILLLFVGVAGALIADSTGETAKHISHPNRQLVSNHSFFAATSSWIYGALLTGEFLVIAIPIAFARLQLPKIKAFFIFIQKILTNNVFSKILAFAGLIAISITGLLGGVIVYGTTADPLADVVLKLLKITL